MRIYLSSVSAKQEPASRERCVTVASLLHALKATDARLPRELISRLLLDLIVLHVERSSIYASRLLIKVVHVDITYAVKAKRWERR